jgi:hypothetical protein
MFALKRAAPSAEPGAQAIAMLRGRLDVARAAGRVLATVLVNVVAFAGAAILR